MDIDDEDDFYAADEPETTTEQPLTSVAAPATATEKSSPRDDLEEGEEEDESGEMDEDDSETDTAAEHKDGSKASTNIPTAPAQSKYSEIRNIPSRTATSDAATKPAPVKKEDIKQEIPPQPTSTIDINPNPVYKPVGKPIMSVSIDEDLSEKEKPWRKPGTDLSDYFNYGFDEFSWCLYADKQAKLRSEYNQDAVQERTKKMMEDMSMMMMPGLTNSMGSMPGMEGIPPEIQAMLQQMMASGMDPNQMDPSAMAAMFAGMQNPAAAGGSGSGGSQGASQNQSFAGQGFGGNQTQGYGGFDQSGGSGGGMNQRGGFGGGRGSRGGRRNW